MQNSPSSETWVDPLGLLERGDRITIDQFVTFQVNQLSTELERQWTRYMRETAGVSLSEWRLLAILDARGPMSFARLAEALAIDKAICSRSAQSLQGQQLLASQPTPNDARSLTLSLTRKGQRLVEKIRPHALARQQLFLSALTEGERRTLYRVIDKLRRVSREWEQQNK